MPEPKPLTCHWLAEGLGRLTLWHRPGKHALPALKAFGVNTVVTLLSESEGARETGALVEAEGLKWVWIPLPDADPPAPGEAYAFILKVFHIMTLLTSSKSVLVHCSAGIHRTGMVAYVLLRMYGYGRAEAFERIGRMRAETRDGLTELRTAWYDALADAGPLTPEEASRFLLEAEAENPDGEYLPPDGTTCWTCREVRVCPVRFDGYNTDADCLMEK